MEHKETTMKNWKTTVAGLLFLVATAGGPVLGLPPKITNVAQGIIVALGLGAAKDHNVSGGAIQQ
jgi:hypothetical protein